VVASWFLVLQDNVRKIITREEIAVAGVRSRGPFVFFIFSRGSFFLFND
jgi:hypothetical protein